MDIFIELLIVLVIYACGFGVGWFLAYRRGLHDGKIIGALGITDTFSESLSKLEKKIAAWSKEIQELTGHE